MNTHHASKRESKAGARAAGGRRAGEVPHPQDVANLIPPAVGRADPDLPFEEGAAHDDLDPDFRHRLISEVAYGKYAGRGYVDGFELDDWLSAEGEVDNMLLNPQYAKAQGSGGR